MLVMWVKLFSTFMFYNKDIMEYGPDEVGYFCINVNDLTNFI